MMRWDIINHLIKENGYKTYLEIGYYKGWSFDRVECEEKWAVDPNPSKDTDEEQWNSADGPMNLSRSSSTNDGEKGARFLLWKETSDKFFSSIAERWKWDIIFIDGLHESRQVNRDIQNALKHLSPGGTIVMHDCNPSSYEMTTTGTALGEWTGDTYKSFIKARNKYRSTHYMYVVDTDYGVGVIKQRENPIGAEICIMWSHKEVENWEEFDRDREFLLNLISPEEFLKRETNVKTTTDNLSSAE